jgi:hypothetical protein
MNSEARAVVLGTIVVACALLLVLIAVMALAFVLAAPIPQAG